jgi:tetratricopeptide (TPR) repeat protein
MRRAGKLGWLWRVAILALVLAQAASGQAAPPVVGKLIFLQGQVVVRPADATQWTPAQLNQEIKAGDAIQTGPSSRAAILCADESQIKLNENTILVLKSVVPSPRLRTWAVSPTEMEAPPPKSKYEILRGEIWLRNKNEKFQFELEAPAVSATIRGTEVNVRVAPDGSTSVILLEGGVCITNPQGEVCLRPGEEGFALPGRAPSKRALVQPQDAVQWSLYYPDVFSFRDLPLTPSPEAVRAPAGPPALATLVAQAEAAYDQGQLEQTRSLAEQVLKQDPLNPRALTLMGFFNLQQHAGAEARDFFQRVRSPDEMTFIGLALARYDFGEVSGAYALLKSARQKLRPTPVLLTLTGYLALAAGAAGEAVDLLTAASRQAPGYGLPRALLAQIYLVQNRKDAARAEAAQALAQAPGSPMALLTMGLVKMSYFDLPAATRYLEKAIAADPRFIDAYVYLAKIQLGSEYLARAQRTIDAALRLAPRDADVLSLAGFVRLGCRDFIGAKKLWDAAIKTNPALGEPHLGLGIYQFEKRNFDQGVAEMLTATLLEPRVALYQTELGKALYQVRNFDRALEVYDYAKTLDPKDPTPYLYKGIALTDLNRPGEAIQEINKSIELNDNVALFRTRLALDRDLAVRNTNLARPYQQLGLPEWAFSKAVDAVKSDPYNSGAHLFVLSSYLSSGASFLSPGQLFAARESENALYRVLSPANQNTFSNLFVGPQNLGLTLDYTPMFEMPYVRAAVLGGVGAWEGSHGIYEAEGLAYGGWPGAAFFVNAAYVDDRGFGPQNNYLRDRRGGVNAKWSPTVNDTFTGTYEYVDQRFGNANFADLGYLGSSNTRSNLYELAYLHRFNPQFAFLAYYFYNNNPFRTVDRFLADGKLAVTDDFEYHNVQLQQLFILGNHTFIGGFDYFTNRIDNRIKFGPAGLNLDFRPPYWSYSLYLLDYWKITPNLTAELGLFKDFSKNARLYSSGTLYTSLWSPRFGLNYRFQAGGTQHTLRLAGFRALSTHYLTQPLLLSSEVASFPWVLDASGGSELREAGAAWEAQWDAKTFSTLRLDALRMATPELPQLGTARSWSVWKRYQAAFIVNRILLPSLGLSLGVAGKRVVPDLSLAPGGLQDYSEIDYTLGLSYLHRDGWLAGVRTILVQQFLKNRDDNLFGLVNLRVGRELPRKRGLVTFEVDNLFNRRFTYVLEPLRSPDFFPSRMYIFRLGLYF